ncbi:MAG: hypothetical protein AAFX93_20115 [Verrucomicrobiota bacterium]
MHSLNIKVADSVDSAPNYNQEGNWTAVTLHSCLVVPNGTQLGKPTVDLQLTDKQGKKYVAMITGDLLIQAGAVIKGVADRPDPQSN